MHESRGKMGAEPLVVLTVALGTMLAPLNSTMIAVALPQVMDEFRVGFRSAGWLVTAYLIAMASLQPVAGNIGDRMVAGVSCWAGWCASGVPQSLRPSPRTCGY